MTRSDLLREMREWAEEARSCADGLVRHIALLDEGRVEPDDVEDLTHHIDDCTARIRRYLRQWPSEGETSAPDLHASRPLPGAPAGVHVCSTKCRSVRVRRDGRAD